MIEGVKVNYQGKRCLPVAEYKRDTGLEPSFGFVSMLREDFRDFVIRESLANVDKPTSQETQEKPSPGAPGFLSAGTLRIEETIEGENGGRPHKAEWDQVLVTEHGVEVVFADDTDDNEVCRVELTDIRYLWTTRGIVSGWINVPLGGQTGSGTTDKSAGPELIPGSLRNGKPWTVEQVLVEKIFPNLPGNPKLKIQKERPAFLAFEVGPKIWKPFVLAKEALSQVLDEFQLVLALNPDATITIWARNKGGLQLDNGQVFGTFDTSDPNCDYRIAQSRALVAYKHVPAIVLVVGAPIIQGIRMRLEPCGMKDGLIVPLAVALQGIGLNMAQATKFAILTHEERAAKMPVSEEGLREFERWAFKWFRLPGGVEANADKLPILDARAALGVTGELLPLRVFSESHTVVKIPFLDRRPTTAGIASRIATKKAQVQEIEDEIAKTFSENERKSLREQRDALKAEIQNLEHLALNVADVTHGLHQLALAKNAADAAVAEAKKKRAAFDAAAAKSGATSPEGIAAQAAWAAAEQASGKAKAELAEATAKDSKSFKATEAAQKKVDEAQKAYEDAVKAGELSLEKLRALTDAQEALREAKKKESGEFGAARASAVADTLAKQIAAAKPQYIRVMVPLAFGEHSSGWSVDHENGIVMFDTVQGRVIATDQDSIASLENGLLSEFAAVELEFAFTRKPGPTRDIELEQSYFSVWTREGSGEFAKVKQLADRPPGAAELPIGPKPELQELHAIDGKTNRPFLDVLSRKLAEAQLKVDQSTVGAVVEFARPVPLVNTGATLSILWQVGSDERPRVVAHVNTYSRLAPQVNELRTRAHGGLVDPGSPANGAIYVPRGLK